MEGKAYSVVSSEFGRRKSGVDFVRGILVFDMGSCKETDGASRKQRILMQRLAIYLPITRRKSLEAFA